MAAFPTQGWRQINDFLRTHARLASEFAAKLGLPPAMTIALAQCYERWDGKGFQTGSEASGFRSRPCSPRSSSHPRRPRTTCLPACVRVRTRTGRWAVIEGAPLEGADRGHAAITIRAATADEVFDFLAKKYDLTRRERQLVALMLDGLATKQLAAVLCISPHTVLDHLKSILATTQLRSRRELLSYLAGRLPQADPRARRGLTRSNTRLSQRPNA
jgi:DNA-binding CsgD family transcriptional regulator